MIAPGRRTTHVLYLARHGETEWNASGRWQGHNDVPLNEAGRAQAAALARLLRAERIAAVASSDLMRARLTAEIVAAALGLSVSYVDADLRERAFGDFEGLTRVECQAQFPGAYARYLEDFRDGPPGGEAHDAVVARLHRALERAVRELEAPALVVTHGGAMRVVLERVLGEAPPPIPNAAVYRIVRAGERWLGAELVLDESE